MMGGAARIANRVAAHPRFRGQDGSVLVLVLVLE